jgi:membrane-bound acyltransferase YfiQ involved in biofilm formation
VGFDADFSVVLGGFTLPAFVFAVAENIVSIGMIFVLIPIFYLKFNSQGVLLQNLSSSAFYMYLIHAPILVAVSLVFASIPLFAIFKFIIVFPLTVILCYLASHYGLKKIL